MAITNRDHTLPSRNKERIQMLVDALRSGKYRQTQGKLARYDRKGKKKRYCCLGVACEVARICGENVKLNLDSETDTYSFNDKSDTLPITIMEWYGFREVNPRVEAPGVDSDRSQLSLAELNDDYGYKFKQIADIIEANYLENDEDSDGNSNP